MKYINVASLNKTYSFKQCLRFGSDEGQIAPSSFPLFCERLQKLEGMTFGERVATILLPFVDDIVYEELVSAANAAADSVGEPSLLKADDGMYALEMWQNEAGYFSRLSAAIQLKIAKLAFKGETLHAFIASNTFECGAIASAVREEGGVSLAAFYPAAYSASLSAAMASSFDGGNASVFAVRAGMADIKSRLHAAVGDSADGRIVVDLSPCNVVRIMIDSAILFSAYLDLSSSDEIELGEEINFAVPAGDLELAMAAIYAKNMGLPVKNIVVAANANRLVTDCVSDGEIDLSRDLYLTTSPAFDVPTPDSLPRFIFELCGRDFSAISSILDSLKRTGTASVENTRDDILSGWADEEDAKETAFSLFDLSDWAVGPHTAIVASVYNDYACETEDATCSVIVSVADPYLTSAATLTSLGGREKDDKKAVFKLEAATALDMNEDIYELAQNNVEIKYLSLADIAQTVSETLK